MTLRLSENSADSAYVIAGIEEHHKLHGYLCSLVEVFKELANFDEHLRNVFDLDIWSVFSVDSVEVISENYALDVENLFLLQVELFTFLQTQGQQDVLVIIVDHSVSEHSLVFVDPKSEEIQRFLASLLVCRANSLENF